MVDLAFFTYVLYHDVQYRSKALHSLFIITREYSNFKCNSKIVQPRQIEVVDTSRPDPLKNKLVLLLILISKLVRGESSKVLLTDARVIIRAGIFYIFIYFF